MIDYDKLFFIDDFQRQIWEETYRYKNETIEETKKRLSENIFKDESKEHRDQLFDGLINKRISFGGRVVANTGIGLKNVNSFNCYSAQRHVKPVDSIKSIYTDLHNAAEILKTEGGIGFDFSHIRPKQTYINGIGSAHPGVIEFMTLFDKSAEIVTKSAHGKVFQSDENKFLKKKIRKGAQIAMLRIEHPDIFDFIESKTVSNKLTKFNISVSVTDKFMKTLFEKPEQKFALLKNGNEVEYFNEPPADTIHLRKGGEFWLWFPNINYSEYDKLWDGDFDNWMKHHPNEIIIYERIPAKKIWDKIIETSYNNNDPGMFFVDNANKYNNILYYQKYCATNPCGEILQMSDPGVAFFNRSDKSWIKNNNVNSKLLVNTDDIYSIKHHGDICNLGHLNFVSYVDVDVNRKIKFDFEKFKNDIRILVRALDDLIDNSGYPLEEIKSSALLRRRIGMGIMGYGSMLFMFGKRYGSDDANKLTEEILSVYANTAYETSAYLAKEKGVFPLYDPEIINYGFIKNSGILKPEIIDLIKKYGLRNSALLTTAPTGNSSIYMGLVSGGVEPVFDLSYFRWVTISHKINSVPELKNLEVPEFWKGKFEETKDFKFSMDGDEQVLISHDKQFKIDKNRGMIQKVPCEDYGWKWANKHYTDLEIKELNKEGVFATAMELSVKEHLDPFKLFSKYIDMSISKTINLSNKYPKSEFSDLFIDLWKSGGRGITTYREGSRTSVLESGKVQNNIQTEQEEFFDIWSSHKNGVVENDVDLPTEYPMMGYILKSEGKKWYFHVAFKDKGMSKPFAIFVQTNHIEPEVNTLNSVELLFDLARKQKIPEHLISDAEKKLSGKTNVAKIARTVGLLLRHNVKLEKIIETLDRVENINVTSFVFTIKKFLTKFVKSGTVSDVKCPTCSTNITFESGCLLCKNCGYSAC